MKSICIVLLSGLITLSFQTFGQQSAKEQGDVFPLIISKESPGKLAIEQDQAIKQLVNRYVDYRKRDNHLPGYRIRIYSNSGQTARKNAEGERTRFLQSYPEVPTYIDYDAPNWKIYVGDFRNKVEALPTYKKIQKEFRNAFLVPAKINLPKL